jgi:hypothetical protein
MAFSPWGSGIPSPRLDDHITILTVKCNQKIAIIPATGMAATEITILGLTALSSAWFDLWGLRLPGQTWPDVIHGNGS